MLLLRGGNLFGWLRYLLQGGRVLAKVFSGAFGRVFGWLGYLLSGVPRLEVPARRPLSVRRSEYITELQCIAAAEEEKNKEIEERLEFKRSEREVLGRIRIAKSYREKLWGRLGEYGVRRFNWKLVMIIGGAILFLLLLFGSC